MTKKQAHKEARNKSLAQPRTKFFVVKIEGDYHVVAGKVKVKAVYRNGCIWRTIPDYGIY